MNYELHPLCTLFPRMVGAKFAELCADIKSNGLRSPITLHQGMILDGGNRYRACVEVGIEPKFIEFGGENLVSFVLSANLHRRHMTAGQQAAIVASAQDWAKAQKRGGDGSNQHASKPATLPDSLKSTVSDRAAQSGVSERTQRMADKVAKEAPELAKKVAHGEISLPNAVKQITPEKPEADAVFEDDEEDWQARYKELEVVNERLEAMAGGQEEAGKLIASLQNRLMLCQRTLRAVETERDHLQRENNQMKREIKALRRKQAA